MINTTSVEGQAKKEEKMSMADRFITAMFIPKDYGKLLRLSVGKLIQFLVLLVLLVSVIRYAIPALGAIAGMGGVKDIILYEIPEFSLKDGEFTLEDDIEKIDEMNGIYLVVDTSVEKYTKEDVPANMVEAVMISKTGILVYNQISGIGELAQETKFSDFGEIDFNNQALAEKAPLIYIGLCVLFVILYIFEMVKYLAMGLFYAVLMHLLTKPVIAELTFGELYKMAMYAQAVGAIISAVMYCINVPILILAASSFSLLITIMIINKALLYMKMQSEL